ncbi:MAG: oligoendopeptidase F [Halanaerobiales bacterium]
MKPRKEVKEDLKWDLSRIFADEEEFEEGLERVKKKKDNIKKRYKGELSDPETILCCLGEYEELMITAHHVYTHAMLAVSVDETNRENAERFNRIKMLLSEVESATSFVESEIKELDAGVIKNAAEKTEDYSVYLSDLLREKDYRLKPEVEKSLSALSPVLEAPLNIYSKSKLADLEFDSFEVEGEEYPLSFVLFENKYEMEPDTVVRRKAFAQFSKSLAGYQHTMAETYATQVQKEKIISDLRGYDDIFEYLLFEQKVDRELYDRQIDLITEELAPKMQKYARLLQEIYGLEKMTFADLKVPVDSDLEPEVTVEESREYIEGALSVLGDEYRDTVLKAYEQRWVDFAQNRGKTTGGFCSTPYGVNPYILLSWSGLMHEVFTLAHELGHAGHYILSQRNNSAFEDSPTRYFVEAPSTLNELFLSRYLLEQKDDPRFRRWVLSTMIGKTYYHNFVTHLLEAAYQREVYELIDAGESISAPGLNELKKKVLEDFWGDAVEIPEGAELTWMRQPHYYMGLYPYTYSAGLTIATAVNQRIEEEGQPAVEDWLDVLRAGGTKRPVELASMAGVDITTDRPLRETIEFIGESIETIVELTEEIEN